MENPEISNKLKLYINKYVDDLYLESYGVSDPDTDSDYDENKKPPISGPKKKKKKPKSKINKNVKVMTIPKDKIVDVIGMDEQKTTLRSMFTGTCLNNFMPQIRNILLYGPPGTGKSYLVSSLAREFPDITFYILSLADISSKYIGGFTVNASKLFDIAEKNGGVVVIDEFDSIAYDRNSTNIPDWKLQLVTFFLEKLGGGLTNGARVIAITNYLKNIDSAIQRRFQSKILIDTPSEKNEYFNLMNFEFSKNIKKWEIFKEILNVDDLYGVLSHFNSYNEKKESILNKENLLNFIYKYISPIIPISATVELSGTKIIKSSQISQNKKYPNRIGGDIKFKFGMTSNEIYKLCQKSLFIANSKLLKSKDVYMHIYKNIKTLVLTFEETKAKFPDDVVKYKNYEIISFVINIDDIIQAFNDLPRDIEDKYFIDIYSK